MELQGFEHMIPCPCTVVYKNCFKFSFERQTDRCALWERGREREGERKRIPSRLCTVSTESDAGLKFTNREITTWAKDGQLTN